jgi:glycosyltransferase involved in cell wall biosynthesis
LTCMIEDTNQNPFITVVIPTYNHAAFLSNCLQSVLGQTYTNLEVIVIDNHSTDDTEKIVASFADKRITYLKIHNNGVIAASRNAGIIKARGKWIAFLDSDDWWTVDKLERCLCMLNERFDIICHGLRWTGNCRDRDVFSGPKSRSTFNSLLYEGNCILTSATIVRKRVLDLVGGFSENQEFITAEDYHLWLTIAKNGGSIGFVHEVLGGYRVHLGNSSGSILRNMNAVQHVVESFINDLKNNSITSNLRIRRRYAIIYYSAARTLQDQRQFTSAWTWFLRSILYWPLSPKTYVGMFLNVFRIAYY